MGGAGSRVQREFVAQRCSDGVVAGLWKSEARPSGFGAEDAGAGAGDGKAGKVLVGGTGAAGRPSGGAGSGTGAPDGGFWAGSSSGHAGPGLCLVGLFDASVGEGETEALLRRAARTVQMTSCVQRFTLFQ